jgi:hypothetical protein
MLEQLPPHVLIVSAVFLLAGAVKGMTGMGLPTVAMGALGAVMPPVVAASLLVVPSFVTNVWQLFAGPSFTGLVSRLSLMMVGILVGNHRGVLGADTGQSGFDDRRSRGSACALRVKRPHYSTLEGEAPDPATTAKQVKGPHEDPLWEALQAYAPASAESSPNSKETRKS